jgi:hypothetical protein
MAITENAFTGEELSAAVKANPGLLDHVKGFLTNEQKLIVRTTDEETAHLKKYEDEKIGERVSEIALNVEKDIEAITGIKKVSKDEKYYDYAKRVLKTLKDSTGDLERQITDLKGKTNLSDAERQRLSQLETALNEKNTEIQTLKDEGSKKENTFKAKADIAKDLAEIRATYKKDLPASLVKIAEDQAVDALLATAKYQDDGTLTFTDKEGKVLTDPKNAYKPKGPKALLQDSLKDLIDTGRAQAGTGKTGTEGANGKTGSNGKFEWTGIPDGVETRVQLSDYLKKNGVLDGSKEFDDIFDKDEVKALKLR